MKRREFITLVFGAAVARPDTARAQQPASRVPRVGYLFSFTPAEGRHLWDACRRGLRELGYVEGQNIVLEPRWADGHHERLGQLAAELAGLKVDVIVSAATPASRAAKAATSSIPIVIVAVGEPVKTGLVASLARPGGNVTGLSLLTTEMSGKRLELLAAIAGNVRSVAIMMNPDNPVHAVFWDETRAAAQTSGVQLQLLKARNPSEIEDAFNAVTRIGLPRSSCSMILSSGAIAYRSLRWRRSDGSRLCTVCESLSMMEGSCPTGPIELTTIGAPRSTWTKFSRVPRQRTWP